MATSTKLYVRPAGNGVDHRLPTTWAMATRTKLLLGEKGGEVVPHAREGATLCNAQCHSQHVKLPRRCAWRSNCVDRRRARDVHCNKQGGHTRSIYYVHVGQRRLPLCSVAWSHAHVMNAKQRATVPQQTMMQASHKGAPTRCSTRLDGSCDTKYPAEVCGGTGIVVQRCHCVYLCRTSRCPGRTLALCCVGSVVYAHHACTS